MYSTFPAYVINWGNNVNTPLESYHVTAKNMNIYVQSTVIFRRGIVI